MIMAYYRLNATDDCLRSVQAILNFANIWRMDNPLTNFGADVCGNILRITSLYLTSPPRCTSRLSQSI